MRSRILLAAVAAMFLAGRASAQTTSSDVPPDENRGRQIVPFLERSYLFSDTEKNLLFEAAIFPHFVLWQNFDELVDARFARTPRDWRKYWAFTITPGVHLRMLREFSDPVRTPSYLPRFDVQHLWSTNYRDAITALDRRSPASVDIWEWHAAVRHHSNGQDGCLFADQTSDGVTCSPSYSQSAAPGAVNKRDGSFATNDVRGGVNFRRTRLDAGGRGKNDVTFGVEYQHQFWTEPDQKPFYPMHRVNAVASTSMTRVPFCANRLELALTATFAVDHPVDRVNRLARAAQVSCFPSTKGGFGFFVQWYGGPNDYNLGFLDNVTRLQFGITFIQDGFFRFRQPR